MYQKLSQSLTTLLPSRVENFTYENESVYN